MKQLIVTILMLSFILSGCAGEGVDPPVVTVLKVGDGATDKMYTIEDLQALPQQTTSFNDVMYIGVSLAVLLEDAGFTPGDLKTVKVIAADGYSVNYDTNQFLGEEVIVAYAQDNGPLGEDDGTLRMVLPGEEGKLNLRMLAEIKVVP